MIWDEDDDSASSPLRALRSGARQLGRAVRNFPVLARGRPLHRHERYAPFFIVGSGRCGSTLLRAALQTHPAVHIPPETYVLGKVIEDYRLYSRLPWTKTVQLVLSSFAFNEHFEAFEISLAELFNELCKEENRLDLAFVLHSFYMYHARYHKPSALRWGDKTPLNTFYLEQIRSVFPDTRIIHLLRDGRDVVQSYVRLGRYSIPDAARRWTQSVKASRRFGREHPATFLEIRYEDLAREPENTLRKVCEFIDLEFGPEMLRHNQVDMSLGDVERLGHHAKVKLPISADGIGKWRSFFNASDAELVERSLEPTLREAGYSRSSCRPTT